MAGMDPFQRAIETARRQLGRDEDKEVSVRELLRRAGYTEGERATVAYHLNPKVERKGGHRIPPELVTRLAGVLSTVVSEDELRQAAIEAAGFTVKLDDAPVDVSAMVARYLGDPAVSEEEKAATRSRLLEIIARQLRPSQD